MELQSNVSLAPFNTLALPGRAEFFCHVRSMPELEEALAHARHHDLPITVLGGGSNVVLRGDIPGLVIRMGLQGVSPRPPVPGSVLVDVAAGEDWPALVEHSLGQGWFGLENLSLIPGTAGAAPIQNIGAYGVELNQRLQSLQALDIASGEILTLSNSDCRFGYRDSIFKQALRDKVIITRITLALSTTASPCLAYPELQRALAATTEPTPLQVHQAVCELRRAKLPDPKVQPNAGSFFKNPVVSSARAQQLRSDYPDLPLYPQADGTVKLPAAWLIDRAGWKGVRRGAFAVHDRQALVLIHDNRELPGCGDQLLAFAAEIVADIDARFAISLEMEPRVLPH